jgi:quercetin dioxygenase-like cupin family protein
MKRDVVASGQSKNFALMMTNCRICQKNVPVAVEEAPILLTMGISKETDMNDNKTAPVGTPFNLQKYIDYSDGSVVSKTLIQKDTGTLTLFAFDAGQGLSEHKAPFDAVVTILDGQAEITIGGKTSTVKTGEMLIMPANITHALHAKERYKMMLVMIRGE